MDKFFVVVSGIPASGKTTLGRAIASRLNLPFLDKDVILESMFDALGSGDEGWRLRLSRASDVVFERLAMVIGRAVLASFWRHPNSPSRDSGTPVEWMQVPGVSVIEIHCHCHPSSAARRFAARVRHPGHLDKERFGDLNALTGQFERQAALGPLGMGELISVDTLDAPERGLSEAVERIQALCPDLASFTE